MSQNVSIDKKLPILIWQKDAEKFQPCFSSTVDWRKFLRIAVVIMCSSQNFKSYHHKNKISNWFYHSTKKNLETKFKKKKNVWNEKFFGPPIVKDRYFEVVLWIMSKYLITCFPHRTNWFKSIRPSLYETLSLPWWILMDGYCVVLFGLKYEI